MDAAEQRFWESILDWWYVDNFGPVELPWVPIPRIRRWRRADGFIIQKHGYTAWLAGYTARCEGKYPAPLDVAMDDLVNHISMGKRPAEEYRAHWMNGYLGIDPDGFLLIPRNR